MNAPSAVETQARMLLDDPAMFCDCSLDAWDHLPPAELDAIQLAGLRCRGRGPGRRWSKTR